MRAASRGLAAGLVLAAGGAMAQDAPPVALPDVEVVGTAPLAGAGPARDRQHHLGVDGHDDRHRQQRARAAGVRATF